MRIGRPSFAIWLLIFSLILSACAGAARTGPVEDAVPTSLPAESPSPPTDVSLTETPNTPVATSTQSHNTPTAQPAPTNVRVDDPNEYAFSQLLPFDGIAPVYNPEFASAEDAPLLDEELVMGIAINGEVKAYPVSVLRFREMVNDELAGLPILVTW